MLQARTVKSNTPFYTPQALSQTSNLIHTHNHAILYLFTVYVPRLQVQLLRNLPGGHM